MLTIQPLNANPNHFEAQKCFEREITEKVALFERRLDDYDAKIRNRTAEVRRISVTKKRTEQNRMVAIVQQTLISANDQTDFNAKIDAYFTNLERWKESLEPKTTEEHIIPEPAPRKRRTGFRRRIKTSNSMWKTAMLMTGVRLNLSRNAHLCSEQLNKVPVPRCNFYFSCFSFFCRYHQVSIPSWKSF